MITFRFHAERTAEAVAFLLRSHGGRMARERLMRLLHAADRQLILDHGKTLTGGTVSLCAVPSLLDGGDWWQAEGSELVLLTNCEAAHLTQRQEAALEAVAATEPEAPTETSWDEVLEANGKGYKIEEVKFRVAEANQIEDAWAEAERSIGMHK